MNEIEWLAVAIVIVTSSARLTRLFTYDDFPPIKWARDKFADITDKAEWSRKWQIVAFCGYCFSFWATAAVTLSGYYSDWHPAWWLINAIFGLSYLAAILMAHDGDDADETETV